MKVGERVEAEGRLESQAGKATDGLNRANTSSNVSTPIRDDRTSIDGRGLIRAGAHQVADDEDTHRLPAAHAPRTRLPQLDVEPHLGGILAHSRCSIIRGNQARSARTPMARSVPIAISSDELADVIQGQDQSPLPSSRISPPTALPGWS